MKHKLKPKWHYMLWLLLILRLILPWTPESSFSVFNLFPFGQNHETKINKMNMQVIAPELDALVKSEPWSYEELGGGVSPATELVPTPLDTPRSLDDYFAVAFQICLLVWLAGIVLLGMYTIRINKRFNRRIRKKAGSVDPDIMHIFECCKEELSIRKPIPFVQSEGVSSPTLIGFMKPIMVMPENTLHTLTYEELRYIFLHEMAHVKRKDIALNWVMNVLLIIHWFNPILWYAYYRMREDQEIACDALVLTYLNPEQSRAYAETIIKLLESYSRPVSFQHPGIATLSGNMKQLKRRMMMIKQFKKGSYRWSILGLATLILLGGVALTNAKGTSQSQAEVDLAKETGKEKEIRPAAASAAPVEIPRIEEVVPVTIASDPQTQILDKMRYSVEAFATVKGRLVEIYNGQSQTTEFQVREGDQPASYVKIGTSETVSSYPYLMDKYNGVVGTIRRLGNPLPVSFFVNHPRIEVINGDKHSTARSDPANSGIAGTVISPEQNALGFLEDYKLWSIQGEDTLLGRSVIVFGGELSSYFKTKHKAETFKMWMDKQTGMLLKREEYDKEGGVTESIEVVELELNAALDESLFQIPEELAEKSLREQAEKRALQPRVTSGDVAIPEAINSKWEDAKDNSEQTSIIKYKGAWYIYPKKGYLVNNIEVDGREGKVILNHAGRKGTIPAVAENYDLDSLTPEDL
ncbi:beta-lactamase regulating signal transducer with metallopeptidase domain [Paenibacillus eucommiae]|uniref:Beta-lactamase regulating signal transducer with metallopeptidase domain n=1 Tax=Paenibacillus eucommiae TaxID=1355755 RepID=A0ABS4IR52_9BACL|nr:beta-lactamase regulating signal transducer with metallopeptidase domain [Paenibacillus eucommiae]